QTGSSRNQFKGSNTDISHARLGIELRVNIGIEIVVLITGESRKSLALDIGKEVWVSFKASSCRLYTSDGNEK
ncbi:MAG TPA: TOBE domain-containing protein, partial [Bacteroidota bacterium]|nr:TOBE domain-containing protein [Bacteroidota bacterium]